jgi:acyl-CoA synthetase (AMP-forming)/AMP-acid ligase II
MINFVKYEDNVICSTIVSLLRMRADQQPRRVGYTYLSAPGTAEITYAELDRRARAIGCMLSELGIRGKLAMLMYPPGIDYIAAFFGCLYAGAIAVPACPPDPMWPDRSLSDLVAVVRDAKPSFVLTTAVTGAVLGSMSRSSPELSRLRIMATDELPAGRAEAWEPVAVPADSIALLQYTSGSMSAPQGVALTHRNLMSNSGRIFRFFGHSAQTRGVTWLPGHDDMGLIGGIIQPLYGGFPVTMLAPADFLREPLSWLQEISRTRATTSGAPNFAYDLCVRKTTPEERSQLDLSSWRVAFSGAEPIRAETMDNFVRAFESVGFRSEAFNPGYSLTCSRPGVKSFAEPRSSPVAQDAARGQDVVRLYCWVGGSRVPTPMAS